MNNRKTMLLTGAVFGMVLSYAMAKCLLSVLMTDIIDEFSLQGTAQGSMSSLVSVGALLALVSMSFLQGHVGKKVMLTFSATILALVLCGISLSGSFALLLVLLTVQGAAMGYLDAYINAMVVDLNGEKSRQALNLLHVFFGIGGFCNAFAVRAIAKGTGWRAAYAVLSGFVVLTLLVFLFLHRKSDSGGRGEEKSFGLQDARGFFTDPVNLLLLCALLLYCAFQNAVAGWITRYMATELDALELSSVGLACYWVGTVTCRLLSVRARFDPMKRLLCGMFLAGLSQIMGIALHSVASVCLCTLLLGLAGGLCVPTLTNAIAKQNSGRTSLASAMCSIMNFLSGIVMPLIMAAFAAKTSLRTAMLLPGFCAVAAGGLLGAYLLRSRKRKA